MRDHSNEPSLSVLAALQRLEFPALAAVAGISLLVLLLWMIPTADELAPTIWSKMPPASAVTLLLASGSLALSAPKSSSSQLRVSALFALIVFAAGAGVMTIYAAGLDAPSDRWLQLPAPQTAASFVLIGISAMFIRRTNGIWSRVADAAVVLLAGVVLFLFAGYVFFVEQFVGSNSGNVTSPQALLCLTLLTCVIAARRAQEGSHLAVLVGNGIGSHIIRIVLPAIIVLPFLTFALIGYLDRAGMVAAAYARAVAAPLEVLAVLVLVTWMAKYTNKLERELRRQSLTDELTGVFNRRGFYAVAEYAIRNAARSNSTLLLFYFDLDRLKQTNDRYGHDVGSTLIKRFSELLAESFRKSDIVARVGGDEFVVLAAGAAESAHEMLERLQANVDADNKLGILPTIISYSAGHSEIEARAGEPLDNLVARADAIMYQQKRRKRKAA